MAITPRFSKEALKAYVYGKRDKLLKATEEAYKEACRKMVVRAKQTNTYKDQTHNLRSSIGCVLFHNGVEVYSYFGDGNQNPEGENTGHAYARKIAEEAGNETFVAVVVAGAGYARYVEAKGYDVITGSSLAFPADLKAEMEMVKKSFENYINRQAEI